MRRHRYTAWQRVWKDLGCAPEDDVFDGRAYYAGRTFMLHDQRILFGWVPTRANETDSANLVYEQRVGQRGLYLGRHVCGA